MLRTLAAGLIALAAALPPFAQDRPRPPALRLGDAATPLAYEATLAVDPRATTFTGEIRIRLRVNAASRVLWLNATGLTIDAAEFRQGERAVAVNVLPGGTEFVGFEASESPFAPGEATARIRYRGSFEPLATRGLFRQLDNGDAYVVSQFEADDARRAFPCFDEPGWKTPWKLTIDAPAKDVVVSNTRELAANDAPGRPGWKRHEFAATVPLPSYLIALAVGPFDVVDGGAAGRNKTPLRYLALRGRGAEIRFAKESTPKVLELLEEYFGSPYPFDKLDSVTIAQTVGFGAMENAGMITYAASLMHAKPHEETSAFRWRYAAVAAHEIAHQWYGDLVTPAWWDDIWLNEAFATWMGRKIAIQYNPAWESGWQRNFGRARALFADRLPSARRVQNPVESKGDIGGAFDRITYDKGGELLSMYEAWLGPEVFRQGVRDYIKAREYGNATSRDFFRALGDAAGKGDAAVSAFNAFVQQPGAPILETSLDCSGPPALVITQRRFQPAGTRLPEMKWTTPACFAYRDGGQARKQCAEIVNGKNVVPLIDAKSCPSWVVGNAGGGGHYVFRADRALDRAIVGHFRELDPAVAVALVNDASLMSRTGLVPVERAVELFGVAMAHRDASVRRAAVEGLRLVSPERLAAGASRAKNGVDAAQVVPAARALGWAVAPGEADDVQELRALLMPYAAQLKAGEPLRAEARRLAVAWLGERKAIDGMMVIPVLDTAARFADRATYEKLEAAALSASDLRERRELQSALAKVRDPGLRQRAFALAIDERMAGRDALAFLEDALADDANRHAAFEFVRTHFDALAARVPPDTPANFARALDRMCTPRDRDDFKAFFEPRAARYRGGQRKYLLSREAIDICVAATTVR